MRGRLASTSRRRAEKSTPPSCSARCALTRALEAPGRSSWLTRRTRARTVAIVQQAALVGRMSPAPRKIAVLHYNETAPKLGPRPMFVARLVQNVRVALEGLAIQSVRATEGRLVVAFGAEVQDDVLQRLSATPGIANIVAAEAWPADLEV